MEATPPKAPGVSKDWEAIERDYRAGVLSVREIARQHAVSHQAINKRAKAQGWSRDLTEKVQQGVKSALVAGAVATSHARGNERQLIEDSVATCVSLVREHRRDIAGGRQMAEVLLGQLQHFAEIREEVEDAIIEETAGDKTTVRRSAMLKAVALPAHAGVLRDLSAVLKNLIPLERQAFNLDALPPPEPPPDAPSVDLERVRRIASRFAAFVRQPVTIEG